jgi:hypothetical protein
MYLCCERFARAFKLRPFWQPIPICTFAEAWNSGDLALRYTYVEFKVVTTWNAKLVSEKNHMSLKGGVEIWCPILDLSKHM